MSWRLPTSRLFPYTTLFRSEEVAAAHSGIEHFEVEEGIVEGCAEFFVGFVFGADVFTPEGFDFLADRKSTRLNSSHVRISYAVFCLKKIICQRGREYATTSG